MSAAPPAHADNAAQVEYWNSVAGRRWTDRQEEQDLVLRPVSDRLIAAADAKPGQRVIDIGCGCGDTTIDFAARVMPGGEALGLDISEPMLARARERAPSTLPARFVLADATVYDFEPAWADLVVSRFGVMFFADPARSFANLRRGPQARRAARLRLLARGQAESVDDDPAARSEEARPAPARDQPRRPRPVRLRRRCARAARLERGRLRRHCRDPAGSRSRPRRSAADSTPPSPARSASDRPAASSTASRKPFAPPRPRTSARLWPSARRATGCRSGRRSGW